MKKIVIIVAVIVILGAGAAAFFILTGGEETEPPEIRVTHDIEVFTTNVRDSRRILRTGVAVVVNEEGMEQFLHENHFAIRDSLVFILRELTEDDIQATGRQDLLRARIVTLLNDRFEIENFVDVILYEFVMA